MRSSKLIWLLILLAARLQQMAMAFDQEPTTISTALASDYEEEGECLEWGYEPQIDFIYPQFGEATKRPLIDHNVYGDIELLDSSTGYGAALPDEFHAPQFEATIQAPAAEKPKMPEDFHAPAFQPTQSPNEQWSMPEDFHAPSFEKSAAQKPSLEEFHAPSFEESATQKPSFDEFHAPQFEQTFPESSVYGDIELLDSSARKDMGLPDEFYAPQFEASSSQAPTTEEPKMPEDFHAPAFQPTQPPNEQWPMPEDFHAPSFEQHPIGQRLPVDDEYGVPALQVKHTTERPTYAPRAYAKSIPFKHDAFVAGEKPSVIVDEAEVPSDSADVYDEFAAVEHEEKERPSYKRRRPTASPVFYKKNSEAKPYKVEKKKEHSAERPKFYDGFENGDEDKTHVEPVRLPSPSADVHDHFVVTEREDKKRNEKPKEESWFGKNYYDSAPITQFFLDLIGAKAPVQDAFSQGLSDETIVEPIRESPEPKAEVFDEFTFGNDEKDEYRSKRSVESVAPPSLTDGLWKLVCIRRRPKAMPVARALVASDFVDFAQDTNDKIQRCIGKIEGEEVAAGLCRKFYLHCAPMIGVRMCSQLNEVFSEAQKQCVPKTELKECAPARPIRQQQISFMSSGKQVETEPVVDNKELLELANGETSDFCLGKADGFYRDATNCTRVLQCFDDDLFEYPPCANSLVFDVKRGLCDYRHNVNSCSNS